MWHQWEEHVNYVGKNWSLADDVAYFIILLNLVGQIFGSVLILFRVLVTPAGTCSINFSFLRNWKGPNFLMNIKKVLSLFVLTIGQTVIYTIIYEPKFLLRHMAMMGALMILLAEHQGLWKLVTTPLYKVWLTSSLKILILDRVARQKKKEKSATPGLPVLTDDTPANCLQLFGRICLILLFCTLLHFWNPSNPGKFCCKKLPTKIFRRTKRYSRSVFRDNWRQKRSDTRFLRFSVYRFSHSGIPY